MQVVVLTAFSDRAQVLAALDAGARGYLLKDAEPDELVSGVRAAARGESPLDPRAAHAVLTAADGGASSPPRARGPRARRRGPAEQADRPRLGISEKTVKAHITKIFPRSA